jgi:MFS family permease
MDYKANIWKLYIIRFFYNLIPAYVIERLFWEQRGMTIEMVVYTEIIFAITVVLLEVPTGFMADRWGRKKMIVLSALLECFMFLILVLATEFWHFAVAIFLAGMARSASSGSENALLYDSLLLQNGQEQDFEKYLGRLNVCDFIAIIIAALCGSLLANLYGFELNYWISVFSMVVSMCVSFLLVEPVVKSKFDDESIDIMGYIKASLHFFRSHPGVCLMVLSGMVTGAAVNFIDEFWQLYLNRLEIPVLYFGLFSAVMIIVRLPGSIMAYLLKKWFQYRTILLGVTAMYTIGFLYVSVIKDFTGLAVIFLICLLSSVMEPITTGYLHHRIHSTMRATIDSFQSLGLNAILIITGLGFGYFSSEFDIFGGYGFISVICAVFFMFILITSKNTIGE